MNMTMNEKELMGIRVTVHRGTNQIGGCVTEYECRGFHLFVDYGEQLPGYEQTNLEIEGLTKGDVSHSALLITHYHGDHIGKVSELIWERLVVRFIESLSFTWLIFQERKVKKNEWWQTELVSLDILFLGFLLRWGLSRLCQ